MRDLKELYIQEKKRNNKFEKEVEELKSDIKRSFNMSDSNKNSNLKGFQNPNDSYHGFNTNNSKEDDVSFVDDMKKQLEYITGINASKNFKNYESWNQDINTLSNEFK